MDIEALFRVRDSVNANDDDLNAQLFKRGDVICWKPSGHKWSQRELTNPNWRILRITGVSLSQARFLVSKDTPQEVGQVIKRRRSVKIDLDFASLPTVVKNWLRDDTRATPIFQATAAQVYDAVTSKAAES